MPHVDSTRDCDLAIAVPRKVRAQTRVISTWPGALLMQDSSKECL